MVVGPTRGSQIFFEKWLFRVSCVALRCFAFLLCCCCCCCLAFLRDCSSYHKFPLTLDLFFSFFCLLHLLYLLTQSTVITPWVLPTPNNLLINLASNSLSSLFHHLHVAALPHTIIFPQPPFLLSYNTLPLMQYSLTLVLLHLILTKKTVLLPLMPLPHLLSPPSIISFSFLYRSVRAVMSDRCVEKSACWND